MVLSTHDYWEDIHSQKAWGAWPDTELDRFLAAMSKLGKFRNILDIGCGNGASIRLTTSLGIKSYGIDISESAIKKTDAFLKENTNGEYELAVGDFKSLPYKDNSFDCVIDICSIQENPVNDLSFIFSEVKRVINGSGVFFTMFRSIDGWLEPELRTTRLSQADLVSMISPLRIVSAESITRTTANCKIPITHHLVIAQKGEVKDCLK